MATHEIPGPFPGTEELTHYHLRQSRELLLSYFADEKPRFPQIVDPSALRTGDLIHKIVGIEGGRTSEEHIVLSIHPDSSGQDVDCLDTPHLHSLQRVFDGLDDIKSSSQFVELLQDESLPSEKRLKDSEWLKQQGFSQSSATLKTLGIGPINLGADIMNAEWNPYVRCHLVQPVELAMGIDAEDLLIEPVTSGLGRAINTVLDKKIDNPSVLRANPHSSAFILEDANVHDHSQNTAINVIRFDREGKYLRFMEFFSDGHLAYDYDINLGSVVLLVGPTDDLSPKARKRLEQLLKDTVQLPLPETTEERLRYLPLEKHLKDLLEKTRAMKIYIE